MPINHLIQIRRDSSSNWNSVNPILSSGEFGLDEDIGYIKIGDGVTNWNDLAYFVPGIGPGSSIDNAIVRWDGTSGIYTKDSIVTISDTGDISGATNLYVTDAVVVDNDYTSDRGLYITTNGLNRWSLSTYYTGEDESGNSSGSILALFSYDDSGNLLDAPMIFQRNQALPIIMGRDVQINETLHVNGNITGGNLSGTNTGDTTASTGGILFGRGDGSGAGAIQEITLSSNLLMTGNVLDVVFPSTYGDVTGAGSSTDNALVRFNGTGGKTIQNSLAILDDYGNLSIQNDTSAFSLSLISYGNDTNITKLIFKSSRGTYASPLKSELNDVVGEILGYGFDGNTFKAITDIKFKQRATDTTTDKLSGEMVFQVRMDLTGNDLSTRAILNEDGLEVIGDVSVGVDLYCNENFYLGGGYSTAGLTISHIGQLSTVSEIISNSYIQSGKSGAAGSFILYPATASKGITTITMTNNSGDTTTNIIVAAQTGARTLTIPDPGALTASFVMTEGNQTIAGTKTFSSTITGSISGNAGTATTLQTARNINGTSFDGSADITITAAAGTLTGTTLNSTVVTSSLTSVGTLTSLTCTGNPTFGPGSGNSFITLISNVGSLVDIIYGSSTSLRWKIRKSNSSESGSNAGSDLQLIAYDDSGSLIGTAFSIPRSTSGTLNVYRATSFSSTVAVSGVLTAPTAATGTNTTQVATTAFVTTAASYSTYYTLLNVGGSHTAGKVAGTYALGYGGVAAVSGTGTLYPIGIIGIYSADFPTVNGLSAKLRIRAQVNCNDVAPTGNYTFGLYPITRPATSGGTGVDTYTIGTVVSGSNGATVSTPAADSQNSLVGSDFALPSDGQYIIAVVTTGTVATNAHVHLNAQLQVHYA